MVIVLVAVNLESIDVVGVSVSEGVGELLKIGGEDLIGADVQSHPRGAAVVRAEQPPIGWVALRKGGSIVSRPNRVARDQITLAVRILVLNPALPGAGITVGKVQPLRPSRVVKCIRGHFIVAVNPV